MLRLPKSLLFPTLNRIGETRFKNQSILKTSLYKVDWSKIEEIKFKRWKEQFDTNPPPVSYCKSLPETLKLWVDNMRFALSEKYLQEIRYCSMKAAEEWEHKRPVIAFGPTISYVDTAFYLLSDCLYDSETNYFSRSGIKLISPFMFLYRFWTYQTPAGTTNMTDLQEFQKLLETLKTEDHETYMIGTKTCQELQDHKKLVEKNHYQSHKETAKPAYNENLEDFLSNKCSDLNLDSATLKIPELGDIFVTQVKFKRSRGKITLKAEFYMQKNLQNPSSKPFDFHIECARILCAKGADIKNISSTPPPKITIEFHTLVPVDNIQDFYGKNHDGEVAKIDLKKIKTISDKEIKALDENPI